MLIIKKGPKSLLSELRTASQHPENHETKRNWNRDCKATINTNFNPCNEMILNILVIS
jgi:hypothetical protein